MVNAEGYLEGLPLVVKFALLNELALMSEVVVIDLTLVLDFWKKSQVCESIHAVLDLRLAVLNVLVLEEWDAGVERLCRLPDMSRVPLEFQALFDIPAAELWDVSNDSDVLTHDGWEVDLEVDAVFLALVVSVGSALIGVFLVELLSVLEWRKMIVFVRLHLNL